MENEDHGLVSRKARSGGKCTPGLLLILVVTFLGLSVFLAVVLIGVSVPFAIRANCDTSTCTTPSCVQLAATVLANMNTSVNPCDDFYNYSCGGWVDENIIPPGRGLWGVFDQLNNKNQVRLKKLIEGDLDSDVSAIQLARQLYEACTDLDTISKMGPQPLIDTLNSTGGWSLIGQGGDSSLDINSNYFRQSKSLGNPAFFSFDLGIDDKNSSVHITELVQSGLTLPSRDSYINPDSTNTTIPALRAYITSTLKLLNPDGNETVFQNAANDIIDFETKLARIQVSAVAQRDPNAAYNKFQLYQLSANKFWNQFDWVSYGIAVYADAGVTVTANLTLLVRTPSYFTQLTDLYDSISKSNPSAIENYFQWQLAQQYVPYLGNDFLDVYYTFTSAVVGSGKVERYLVCLSSLQTFVPMSMARLYTMYVLDPGTRANVTIMIEQVKNAFKQRLQSNPWLDSQTIQASVAKVETITQMVAYPDSIFNNEYLLNRSTAVNMSVGDNMYFKTFKNFQLLSGRESLQQYGKPVNKTGWEISPTAVNAYYDPLFNAFVFLEGILQPPFFEAGWPDYFKYGALGVVIGHELTHGFDDQGQQYNKDGILTPWWSVASQKEFNQRKQCFVEQYSKYSLFGYNINGSLTLGENIADNGGVHTAFQAYGNVAATSAQPGLPAIKLTSNQLFFVSFGQVWCSLFTPTFIRSNLQTNPHSPGPYRVLGALSNSKDFATAFNCPQNSPMNPTDKCELW